MGRGDLCNVHIHSAHCPDPSHIAFAMPQAQASWVSAMHGSSLRLKMSTVSALSRGTDRHEMTCFPVELGLASMQKEGNSILRNMNNQEALSYLCHFPILTNITLKVITEKKRKSNQNTYTYINY